VIGRTARHHHPAAVPLVGAAPTARNRRIVLPAGLMQQASRARFHVEHEKDGNFIGVDIQ
jgi:hypothetical protein